MFQDVVVNGIIQGGFTYYYLSKRILSYTYESYVEYLIKEINMPEIQKDSSLIQDIVKKIKPQNALLSLRDGCFRIRASQGSGIDAMHIYGEKGEPGTYKGAKIPEYDLAYVELTSILKSIILLKNENISNRIFWEGIKTWGEFRIFNLEDGPMGVLYREYRDLKVGEDKTLDGSWERYFDDFLMEMAKIHELYSEFILTGKLKKKSVEKYDLYNDKFHFYLHLVYEYVSYYSEAKYRYLALYSLEYIYAANTIFGIWSQGNRVPIHRKYIPTKKYLQPTSESGKVWMWNKRGGNGRLHIENKYNKEIFCMYELITCFYQCLFEKMGTLKDPEKKRCYEENLLKFINNRLDNWPQNWGMISDEYSPLTKIDFYQWFLYRPFILNARCFKSSEEFFGEAYMGEKMLDFVFDWKHVEDESRIGNIVASFKKYKQLNDPNGIENIMKKIYKISDCNKTMKQIHDMYKDHREPEEEMLNYMLNERRTHNQKKISNIKTFLEEYNLIDNQEAIDSIAVQIYRSEDLGKVMDKICDEYIEEFRAYAESKKKISMEEINQKMGIKVQEHGRLMWNIYVKIFNTMRKDDRVDELFEKYRLSFRQPLIHQKCVQLVIKDIIRKHKVYGYNLLFYAAYLKRASWLPKEDVDFMFDKILPRQIPIVIGTHSGRMCELMVSLAEN